MKSNVLVCFLLLFSVLALGTEAGNPEGMVHIPSGFYLPLYAVKKQKVYVESFWVDALPVTNKDFLQFVKKNKKWTKSKVKKIFAEKAYLNDWKNDEAIEDDLQKKPVVNISWFAAKAYCEWHGKQLPTVDQWEYLFSLDIQDKVVQQKISDWYGRPSSEKVEKVGRNAKNKLGVYDLFGLIWEWTLDFNTAMVTGESRGDSAIERNLYCGAGAVGSSNFKDYAAFMRFAYRSSLKANFTTTNLGFRCVK